MRSQRSCLIILIILMLLCASAVCAVVAIGGSTKGIDNETLFDGVTYTKEVRTSPRRMVVHIVEINVAKSGIRPFVTPADRPKSDQPYDARTTSDFMKEYSVQLAINGSGFSPWYDRSVVYYPHPGDPVAPLGTTISDGFTFMWEGDTRPLLKFGGKRPVDIGYIDGDAEYAVSGIRMLIDDGKILEDLNTTQTAPRTAAGISQDGHKMVIVVVDGRQPFYSQGATILELAKILEEHGAYFALELDGGGSSTLVVEQNGKPVVLNSPVHRHIPGNQRPVANHVGFYIKQ
ncbi:MAG TPA: phosphodiester glycosidase family protein [Anaerolineales bacterium]|nr:phosphodiester glycosidase family protein [Anaerolineales bacterium]